MSLVTLPEARVRLEGDLEILEAAVARYRAALEATQGRGRGWNVEALALLLDGADDLEPRVDQALEHLARRSSLDGWVSKSPALLLANELRRARAKLSARLHARDADWGPDLPARLRSCARFSAKASALRAREQAASARWELDSALGILPTLGSIHLIFATGVFSITHIISRGAARAAFAVLLGLLLFTIWRSTRFRNELRIYFSERCIEAWRGFKPEVKHLWTVELGDGATLGIRKLPRTRSPSFDLFVVQAHGPDRTLQSFQSLEKAREARLHLLNGMKLFGSESPVLTSAEEGDRWLFHITGSGVWG